jgi:hypothetical protein
MRWPEVTWKQILLTLLAGAGLLLLWRAAPGRPIEAQVVDAQTGQPLAGAVVVGVWTREAGLPGFYYRKLVGVIEMETDSQGRFTLGRPWSLFSRQESVTVYKFGYIAWNNLFLFPLMERRQDSQVPPTVPIERFPEAGSHRRHIGFIEMATSPIMFSPEIDPLSLERAMRPEYDLP